MTFTDNEEMDEAAFRAAVLLAGYRMVSLSQPRGVIAVYRGNRYMFNFHLNTAIKNREFHYLWNFITSDWEFGRGPPK